MKKKTAWNYNDQTLIKEVRATASGTRLTLEAPEHIELGSEGYYYDRDRTGSPTHITTPHNEVPGKVAEMADRLRQHLRSAQLVFVDADSAVKTKKNSWCRHEQGSSETYYLEVSLTVDIDNKSPKEVKDYLLATGEFH